MAWNECGEYEYSGPTEEEIINWNEANDYVNEGRDNAPSAEELEAEDFNDDPGPWDSSEDDNERLDEDLDNGGASL